MRSNAYFLTFSEFFLDGAKIIFGSVVVGAFVPGVSSPTSWFTFFIGIIATIFFLAVSALMTNLLEKQKI